MMSPVQNIVMQIADISYYQGQVDFEKMKAAGINAVIIRAGYGTTIDKLFITYINAAIKAGMNIGIYWFIYAANENASTNNAKKCMEVITPYKVYINCGVYADFEYDSDLKAGMKLTPAKRSAIVEKFNSTLAKAGYEVGIYSNQDYIKSGKFTASLIAKYPLWFAKYSKPYVNTYAKKGKNGLPYMVQYTSSGVGSKYGVSSKSLDLDYGYVNIVPAKAQDSVADKVTTSPGVITAKDNPYIKPTRVIYYDPKKKMMYGDDVKWIQWHLWRFGLFLDKNGIPDKTMIDGYFGKDSANALAEAQKRLNLKVDKVAGELTIAAFEKV